MITPDFTSTSWRKSTYSNGNGNCVEVAWTADAVGIRDSKECGRGPVVVTSPWQWKAFLQHVVSNEGNTM
ncbi:DUF397 domain-containing protein [Amycolatopsis nigrescens]|uniref:DUF397 domain-containing protein n=1 Tax=Amycolatopsis nigrescens TaxID=381445 RepID=UPI000A0249F2|nr:DUF397 domain-containing protein [Amycolatopsis nigrescens]